MNLKQQITNLTINTMIKYKINIELECIPLMGKTDIEEYIEKMSTSNLNVKNIKIKTGEIKSTFFEDLPIITKDQKIKIREIANIVFRNNYGYHKKDHFYIPSGNPKSGRDRTIRLFRCTEDNTNYNDDDELIFTGTYEQMKEFLEQVDKKYNN